MPGVPYLPPAHHWDIYDSYFDWDVNQRLIIKTLLGTQKQLTLSIQYSLNSVISIREALLLHNNNLKVTITKNIHTAICSRPFTSHPNIQRQILTHLHLNDIIDYEPR